MASDRGSRPARAIASIPRVTATPTPMVTASMSKMTMTDMTSPNALEPNSPPDARLCSGKPLFSQAVALRPNPMSWA